MIVIIWINDNNDYAWYCNIGVDKLGCGVEFILKAENPLLYQSSSASCLIAAAIFCVVWVIENGWAVIEGYDEVVIGLYLVVLIELMAFALGYW